MKTQENQHAQKTWEKSATVRARPRRELLDNVGSFFPKSRQPLCLHPLINRLGEDAIRFIQIQSAYKFMWDIAQIETKVVNEVAEKIANDGFKITFSETVKFNALTVLVDESYHAYVARDFICQLENLTNISPVKAVFSPTGLYMALKESCSGLSTEDANLFKLVAISIAENSITNDLISLNRDSDEDINNVFYQVNQDHMVDEARHSKIFRDVLTFSWDSFSESEKLRIGKEIPNFLKEYLDPKYQKDLNLGILTELKLSEKEKSQVIHDTHVDYSKESFKAINPIVKNVTDFLARCKVLQHKPTCRAFSEHGLL